MTLTNDYFLLFHGIHLSDEDPFEIDEKIDDETFFEISALLLSITRNTFEQIQSLSSFAEITQHFTAKEIQNIQMLYHLQKSIITHFFTFIIIPPFVDFNSIDPIHVSS